MMIIKVDFYIINDLLNFENMNKYSGLSKLLIYL